MPGILQLRHHVEVVAYDRNPVRPPSRLKPELRSNPEVLAQLDWWAWSARDWVHTIPDHLSVVNASIQLPVWNDLTAEKKPHLVDFIARGAGFAGWPDTVFLDRTVIAEISPDGPAGAVVYQPTCSEPEKTPVDLMYARLPRGTIVVRKGTDPGIPRELIERYGYVEWVDRPLEDVVGLIARAVVVVASLLPVLGALMRVPTVMVHEITLPEHCGITPWGGIDVVSPKDQRSLEELFAKVIHDDSVRGEDVALSLVR
ncbi:MAG: hypothetical protein ABFS86_16390 [Planctomycetota bacterium]